MNMETWYYWEVKPEDVECDYEYEENELNEFAELDEEDWIEQKKAKALQGDVKAQYDLGVYFGDVEGAYWLQKAAWQGNTGAQSELGLCYANGDGVPIDRDTALYWLESALKIEEKALKNGDCTKKYQLGIANLNRLISKLKAKGYSASRAKIEYETVESNSYHSSNNLENDYKVLEIDSSASNEEVKRAYYNQMANHHPDKVSHLGEHIKKFAEGHCAKVNAAYERIKKEREIS
jgi:DnaJ-domain-containing protein 1